MRVTGLFSALTLGLAALGLAHDPSKKQANIVLVMTDNQDRRLGSMDYQSVLQREVKAKGTEFVNHYATTANCCPSRTSLLRGQMVHNTNVTHVNAPGGSYDKFHLSGQDTDYLPFWMRDAGYGVEYVGKFLNGYSQKNYNLTPKDWDRVDALIDPYTYVFSTPVISLDGQRPIYYEGYHQSDVIRAKALDRVEYLTSQDKFFLLVLAPSAPHMENDKKQSIPLSRHAKDFKDATAPRWRSWNSTDEYQKNKGSWLSTLPLMNDLVQAYADHNNGYHIGNHRIPAGNAKETLNVEFWGLCIIEAPNAADLGVPFQSNSYKTLRIVGEDEAWLYSRWYTGEMELYNTAEDPYELNNLAINPSRASSRLMDRLNAILLVTKSCE
ncbi:hypothetical protein FALCPG4_005583 [Fusarium falciforme]